MDKSLENCKGIQFNGWNFAHICDWIMNKDGTYPAQYFEEITINGNVVKRHDWIIKNDDGSFAIMTNQEHKDWMDRLL